MCYKIQQEWYCIEDAADGGNGSETKRTDEEEGGGDSYVPSNTNYQLNWCHRDVLWLHRRAIISLEKNYLTCDESKTL